MRPRFDRCPTRTEPFDRSVIPLPANRDRTPVFDSLMQVARVSLRPGGWHPSAPVDPRAIPVNLPDGEVNPLGGIPHALLCRMNWFSSFPWPGGQGRTYPRSESALSGSPLRNMLEEPQIVSTADQYTACIRFLIPRSAIRTVVSPALAELRSVVAAQGVEFAGAMLFHHNRSDPDIFDFQLSMPTNRPVAPRGRVKPGRMDATQVARAIYRGPHEGLPGAWRKLNAWVESRCLRARVDFWEVVLTGPEVSSDPSAWRTELNRPFVA